MVRYVERFLSYASIASIVFIFCEEPVTFEEIKNPAKLVYPKHKEILYTNNLTFTWEPSTPLSSIDYYIIRIDGNEVGRTSDTEFTYVVENPTLNKPYYWDVTAANEFQYFKSITKLFYINTSIYSNDCINFKSVKPYNLLDNGPVCMGSTINFSWNSISYGTYVLQIDTGLGFINLDVYNNSSGTYTFTSSPSTIYWRVLHIVENCGFETSEVKEVEILEKATASNLRYSVQGCTNLVLFEWEPSISGTFYIEYGPIGFIQGSGIVLGSTQDSYLESTFTAGNYDWFLIIDNNPCERVILGPNSLYVPTLEIPVVPTGLADNSPINVPNLLVMSWNDAGYGYYEVQVDINPGSGFNWVDVSAIGNTATYYVDSSFKCQSSYKWRVRHVTACGTSTWSQSNWITQNCS